MGQGNKNRNSSPARDATPSLLQKIDIYSAQKGSKNSVSVLGGTVRVLYWESILSDSVRASVTFTDAGNTLRSTKQTKRGRRSTAKKVSAVEGLPIEGSEEVYLKFTDNKGITLDFGKKNNNSLFVNACKHLPTGSETTDKTYMLELAPLEWITNEKGGYDVRKAYSGQISDSVRKILKDVLKTKKDLDIERTNSELDFCGNNTKPYFTLNDLATKAVSNDVRNVGETAGYLFWETTKSYHFKSIDTLMAQKFKQSIIYNESSETIPKPYNVKALTMETENKVNVKKKLSMGAYSNRYISLDPFSGEYTNKLNDAQVFSEGNEVKLGGEELPSLNTAFNTEGVADTEFSKTSFQIASTGQKFVGSVSGQLQDSKKQNFDTGAIFNQAKMRYNQLFASQVTIVIPGDFSLHAGDSVYFDPPETDTTENKACGDEVDKRTGGKYLITDLCHHITATDTYTKLVLVRDSFGRTGNPSKGYEPLSSNVEKAMSLGSGGNFL